MSYRTNVVAFYLTCCGIHHSNRKYFDWMPRHVTLNASASSLCMPRMLRHWTMDAASSILCIFTIKSFPLTHVAAFTIACCGMLFSYMFQYLGILPCMLRHTPCVFPSCCSIELPMLWINMNINQSLPQNSQRYWFSLVLTCFSFFNQQSYTI